MNQLDSMKIFQQVVDLGSFAAAGRALNMSPANVTRKLAALENHLGVRLLQRSSRKQALTEAGDAYLLRVRSILREIEEAETEASKQTQELRGVIHVIATPLLASTFLSPLIAPWQARHPKVMFDLVVDPFPHHRIEEFDLSLLAFDEGFNGSLVARPLATTEWVACASPAYLKSAGTPQTPDQLHQHAHLKFQWPQGSSHFGARIKLHPLHGGVPVEVELLPAFETTSFEVLLSAALAGAGVAFLSRLQLDLHLQRGALVQILPDWILGRFTVYAALPSSKYIPSRTRVFLDFLTEFSAQLPTRH
ncbi:MAG: LysR family transcriptional regulator [Burkholderiaceae bacterium]